MLKKNNTIYKKIKIRLIEKELTMVDLAKEVGLSRPYVSNLIAGRRKNEEAWKKILKALEINDKAA
jgi:transcriptional regulator with XRE-family HTH domain